MQAVVTVRQFMHIDTAKTGSGRYWDVLCFSFLCFCNAQAAVACVSRLHGHCDDLQFVRQLAVA